MMRRMVLGLLIAGIAVSVTACGILGGGSDLTGKTWKWEASTTAVPASQSVTPEPRNYTITFNSDGTYEGKADCNQIAGSYTVSGSSLTIEAGPSTMAFCGEESLDQLFLAGLLSTTTYKINAGSLILSNEAGDTMTFTS
jgi:heat shock protein HslJ